MFFQLFPIFFHWRNEKDNFFLGCFLLDFRPNHLLLWWQISVKNYINRVSSFSKCFIETFLDRNCPLRYCQINPNEKGNTYKIFFSEFTLPKPNKGTSLKDMFYSRKLLLKRSVLNEVNNWAHNLHELGFPIVIDQDWTQLRW